MTDYICLTLLADAGEVENVFKARLAAFWTHMLRNRPELYAKMYAEATRFGWENGRIHRQYMVAADAIELIVAELSTNRIEYMPVDPEETYSKYEAAGPDWFQIDH